MSHSHAAIRFQEISERLAATELSQKKLARTNLGQRSWAKKLGQKVGRAPGAADTHKDPPAAP